MMPSWFRAICGWNGDHVCGYVCFVLWLFWYFQRFVLFLQGQRIWKCLVRKATISGIRTQSQVSTTKRCKEWPWIECGGILNVERFWPKLAKKKSLHIHYFPLRASSVTTNIQSFIFTSPPPFDSCMRHTNMLNDMF